MTEKLILKVKDLHTYFEVHDKTYKAVDGVSFRIKERETLCIVGESGSGKSVTSLSIMGLVPEPNGEIIKGSVIFNGVDLTKLKNRELSNIRGKDMSMIFQEPMTSLNPVLTIGFQLSEGLIKHKGITKQQAKKESIRLLQVVGIARAEEIYDSFPHQLSGGMRQRVMIAMAISCNPKLLIADEPTTALDVTIQAQILEIMKDIREEMNSSILLITHDLGVVAEMADRVIVMYAGQIVEEATVTQIFDNPKHPYTQGLLKSIPKIDVEQERLSQIQGIVPSSDDFPEGCRFAPRCKFATEQCIQGNIQSIQVDEEHKVRCILYQ